MDVGIWEELYRDISVPTLQNTVVGLNVNLDRILSVTPDLLESPLFHHPDIADLYSRLLQSMPYYTAEEWFISDPGQYRRFTRSFASFGSLSLGGQAGIAALHLARLGVPRVVCAAPFHGPESAAILKRSGILVPEFSTGNAPAGDIIHLVFEYPAGLVPPAPRVIPRNNRFIVSPVHEPATALIPKDRMEGFLKEIAPCNRAFLSGYQYLSSDEEYSAARDQILRLKDRNPSLRIHIEWVSVSDETIIRNMICHILPVADSLGLNENELALMLRSLGLLPIHEPKNPPLTPVQVMEGALTLCRNLGLKRIHIHTFGYYVLVIRRNGINAELSRNALLFASREVAHAANGTGTDLSEAGIRAVGMAEAAFGPASSPGIYPLKSHVLVVVPTLIVRNITRTTGLGDILSSTALVADEF